MRLTLALRHAGRARSQQIATSSELRRAVQDWLELKWSPEQIAPCSQRDYPDRPEMHVSHETIYQALYVQVRGDYAAS